MYANTAFQPGRIGLTLEYMVSCMVFATFTLAECASVLDSAGRIPSAERAVIVAFVYFEDFLRRIER